MADGAPVATTTAWSRLRAALPEGLELPKATWETRHRTVLIVLILHAVALPVFGAIRGWGPGFTIGEGVLLAGLAWAASLDGLTRRLRASLAALGCVTSSAILVQFSGGYIEAHFHFFVIVALVAMYQDWVPFLLAIMYVALDHGIVGMLAPEWVYNHTGGIERPWTWAAIHAAAVLAECAALLAFWSSAEEARARSDLFLKSAGDGILGLDLNGKVTFANPAAATLLGGTVDGLVGKPATAWIPAWSPGGHLGQPGEGHLAQGTAHIPIEWLVTPTVRSGLTVGYVLTLKDLTHRLRAEEDRRKVEMLVEQDKFKTQLLNTASHELNTPLGLLRLQLHLLNAEAEKTTPTMRDGFVRLRKNVERLSALVKDTLDVSRIESGKMPLSKQTADLAVLASEAREFFAEAARSKDIRLASQVVGPLPAEIDVNRIGQVLVNLVGNAVKFTPRGGTIEITARAADGKTRIEVRDSGPGISAEDQSLLFRPFSQLAKNPDGAGGAGLGLFICKGIVEQHGGRIWCEPNRPNGAVFVFELPLLMPQAAALAPMAA